MSMKMKSKYERPVSTPDGEFENIAAAAEHAGISGRAACTRVHYGRFGWHWAEVGNRIFTPQCVLTNVGEAAKWASITIDAAYARIKRGAFGWRLATHVEARTAVSSEDAPRYVRSRVEYGQPVRTPQCVLTNADEAAKWASITIDAAKHRINNGSHGWRRATAVEAMSAVSADEAPRCAAPPPTYCYAVKTAQCVLTSIREAAKWACIPYATAHNRTSEGRCGWRRATAIEAATAVTADQAPPYEPPRSRSSLAHMAPRNPISETDGIRS